MTSNEAVFLYDITGSAPEQLLRYDYGQPGFGEDVAYDAEGGVVAVANPNDTLYSNRGSVLLYR